MYVQKPVVFAPVPTGLHMAVCSRFVDLGTKYNEMYKKNQHEVMVTWQIPSIRVKVDDADLPIQHNEFYTWSMHPDSNLRKMLESWRGTSFTPADLAGPPDGFNTRKLIGVGCQLQIMLKENGKAFASATLPLPRDSWPKIEGEPTYFQMAEQPLDMAAFERLTDGLKNGIQESPEWKAMTDVAPIQHGSGGGTSVEDDVIPF